MFKWRHNIIAVYLTVFMVISLNGYAQKPTAESPTVLAAKTKSVTSSSDSSSSDFSPVSSDRLRKLMEHLKTKGFDIKKLLNDPRFELYDGIGDHFRNSAEKTSLNLESYKRILGFNAKKDNIAAFMKAHANQLDKAEQQFGVPKYVIAAIIGIESDFGKNAGDYNPFNIYVSMYAESYRASFAFNQLTHLLTFVKNRNLDVFSLKSSYAGAMTFGQFIPYSMNKWFIGDDILDMNNNIMSVANYLSYFKERTGSIKKAVHRYNPSGLYTRAVLDLADAAKKQYKSS